MTNSAKSVKYAPIVQLDKGLVRGIVQEVDDSEIYLYQGIRYGRANRFEKAQPVEPWSGVYDATTVRDNPPQLGIENPDMEHVSKTMSEDCLMLNVWKPIRKSSTPRAVMVYIFGGRFNTGSIYMSYLDSRWIAHRGDVIVVAMNFRLGPFGFMYGDDQVAPANLGLHDQILALQWVQENIAKFGGNPNSVTIFGCSSGSMSVAMLMLSPLTKGLFQRAILQSGHALGYKHKHKSFDYIKYIARNLNCDDNLEIKEIIEIFKTKTVEELLNAAQGFRILYDLLYGDELLPVSPEDALLSGNYNTDIDLLYGTTRDEGIFITLYDFYDELGDEQFELTLEKAREYVVKIVGNKHGDAAADFYISKYRLNETSSKEDLMKLIFQVYGDHVFTAGVILTGEHHARHSIVHGRGIFAWQLVQPAEAQVVTPWSPKFPGVYHGDELFYLFTINKQSKPEDIKLSHEMIKAWTQFSKNGDPGTVGKERWMPAVDHEDFSTKFMALGYESMMVSGYYQEMCDFWKDKLFSKTIVTESKL